MNCYYGTDQCGDELWQCETCKEWYCRELHWHETSLGHCVECVACETERIDEEAAEDDLKEYRVTFANCTVEVRHVLAESEDEAVEQAERIVCTDAGTKTRFDVWLGYGETEEE